MKNNKKGYGMKKGGTMKKHLQVGDLVYKVEDPTETGLVIKIDPIFHLLVDVAWYRSRRVVHNVSAYTIKRVKP